MPAVHLIPADEDWMAMLRQIEEPLLLHLLGDDDDEWQLPEVFKGQLARDAWWRIFQAVRDAFALAGRHRLLAADGHYELAPLAVAEIEAADLEVLNRVAYECSRARAGLGSAELAELLEGLEPGGPVVGPGEQSPIEALVKVVNTLGLQPDGDMRLLLEVIRRGAGADIVLTEEEQDAYRRYVRRFVARMGGGGLELFSYGADR